MSNQVINGEYAIDLLPTQQKVMDCVNEMRTANVMYCGGFGSGKTRLIGELSWELGIAYPRARIGIFRKTRNACYFTTYRVFTDEVMVEDYVADWRKGTLEVELCNGSLLQFFGIDNFERKASLQYDVILVEEATELEEEDHIMLQGRLRGKNIPLPMYIVVCNPGAPGTFLHRMFVENAESATPDTDYAYYHTNSYENIHNPKAYFLRLAKWKGTQYYDRYVLSLWTAYRGVIYDLYDPRRHQCHPFPIPNTWRKLVGVDFGFEHPLVLHWYAQDPLTNRWYLYRQYHHTRVLVRDAALIGKTLETKTGEVYEDIWADHDAENRAQFESDWKETRAAHKEVMAGIQTVYETMLDIESDGKPGLIIFTDEWADKEGFWYGNIDKDPMLIEENRPASFQDELGKYKWGKNDSPIKIGDDACDTARYTLHSDKIENNIGGINGQQAPRKIPYNRR